jgi:DNA-binding LacI/PurR family transcriptional regulator
MPDETASWIARQAAIGIGRRVPEDLSLVCLSKTAVEDFFTPVTTGVDLRAAEQAEQAVALLLDLLSRASPADRQLLLEPQWVAGATTAPV